MCDLSANGIKLNSEKKGTKLASATPTSDSIRPPDATMQKKEGQSAANNLSRLLRL